MLEKKSRLIYDKEQTLNEKKFYRIASTLMKFDRLSLNQSDNPIIYISIDANQI